MIASFYLAGAVSRALFFGHLTDRFRRKKLFFGTLIGTGSRTDLFYGTWSVLRGCRSYLGCEGEKNLAGEGCCASLSS